MSCLYSILDSQFADHSVCRMWLSLTIFMSFLQVVIYSFVHHMTTGQTSTPSFLQCLWSTNMATGGVASARERFELQGVHEVGHGSHTVVKSSSLQAEVCWQKIHGILFNSVSPPEQRAMLEHFVGECELLGGLCIVQFLDVCLSRAPPCLCWWWSTLSACLERYGVLPKEIRYGILCDLAVGLVYLHEHFHQ